MNNVKSGNLAKLVAFFLIALVLTCTVAFAASDWQTENPNKPDSDEALGDDSSNSEDDENKDGNTPPQEDIPVVLPVPEYLNYITGTEITQEDAMKKPLCFIYETNSALYGISSSFLTVEIPIENGNTRFLTFSYDATSQEKIGTLAPTRRYISNIASAFGGVLFAYGNDDSFNYAGTDSSSTVLDFKNQNGYHYTEYSEYAYTNCDLLAAFIRNSGIGTSFTYPHSVPYNFIEYYSDEIVNSKIAKKIVVSYSDSNSTEFSYNATAGNYTLTKNNQTKRDLLNNKTLSYDNVFVLFASSEIRETEQATQTIIDTLNGGKGYYFTNGTAIEITWGYDAEGKLTFYDKDMQKLTVNRGTSYVSFAKASQMSKVNFS